MMNSKLLINLNKLVNIGEIYYQSLKDSSKELKGSSPILYDYHSLYLKFISAGFRVFKGSPEVKVFNDVIYMPQFPCLYSRNGLRINCSCLYRGPGRTELATKAPDKIEPPKIFKKVSQRMIYGGEITLHYGHFLTESISRLWYALKDEQCPILFHGLDKSNVRQKTFLDMFFEPVNLDKRLISFEVPVLLKEVIIPYPSFLNRCEAFENHKLLPENITKSVLSARPSTSQPLYFSRRLLNSRQRKVINEYELEKKLHDNGFAICFPEKLSLQQQIYLINKHEVVVGVIGSALHNILFDTSPRRYIVYLGDRGYINTNFLMIDAIKSANSVYIGALKKDRNCSKDNSNSQNRIIDLGVAIEGLRKFNLI